MLSPCCGVPCYEAFGELLCSACYAVIAPVAIRITAQPRDIVSWVFTARDLNGKPIPLPSQPPKGEPVFVRNGKRIRRVDKIRGKPDGWAWVDC